MSLFDRTGELVTLSTYMYVVDPTGEGREPSISTVLGRRVPRVIPVMPFTTRSSCSWNRDTLCSSVMQEDVVCTDCIYTRWNTFAS